MSAQWPLYFSNRESIEGKGFVAVVSMQGRCLGAREHRSDDGGDAFVLYGVQPSSLSAEADSLPAAFAVFRERLKDVLFGFADDAADFEEFRAMVDGFFNDVDADAGEWASLAAEIRAGKAVEEGSVSGLPRRVPHETEPTLTVEDASKQTYVPSPTNNVRSDMFLPVAA